MFFIFISIQGKQRKMLKIFDAIRIVSGKKQFYPMNGVRVLTVIDSPKLDVCFLVTGAC